jgi:hypothetical protein
MSSLVKLDVLVERISRKPGAQMRVSASYDGFLVVRPKVGVQLVIFTVAGTRVTTSPVVRLLTDDDGSTTFAETQNSTYRIRFESAGAAKPSATRNEDSGATRVVSRR